MLTLRRVLLVLTVLSMSGMLAIRSARARLGQLGLDWSARLLDLPAEWQTMEPRELLLNGARFGIVSGHSELSAPDLLDRVQASCRERMQVSAAPLPHGNPLPGVLDGVLRVDAEQAGMVACLELGGEPLGAREVLRRLQTFTETGDLAQIGAIRLVRVEAREEGAFFVAVASEGPLPLPLLFPSEGDVPGLDPEHAPRPAAARRLLSVRQLGHEPSITMYESAGALDTTFASYLKSVLAAGFVELSDTPGEDGTRAALFDRDGHHLLVVGARIDSAHSALVVSALDTVGAGDFHNSTLAPQPH